MTNLKKTKAGCGYKYADLAQTNDALAEMGYTYYQYTDTDENGNDYIWTVPVIIETGAELKPRRGCRIVNATLSGKSNPAQEQGSAITYARRYSLWMAFGLATEDDDAQCLTKEPVKKTEPVADKISPAKAKAFKALLDEHGIETKYIYGCLKGKSYTEMTEEEHSYMVNNITKFAEGYKSWKARQH